jgi:hypothetical protein
MGVNIYNADISLLLATFDNCRTRGIMGCHPNVGMSEQYVIRGGLVVYKLFHCLPTLQLYLPCNRWSSNAYT